MVDELHVASAFANVYSVRILNDVAGWRSMKAKQMITVVAPFIVAIGLLFYAGPDLIRTAADGPIFNSFSLNLAYEIVCMATIIGIWAFAYWSPRFAGTNITIKILFSFLFLGGTAVLKALWFDDFMRQMVGTAG
ncbi:hypothetical protein [Hyphococcus sp.]